MSINPQTAVAIPTREPGDYKFTVRQNDWQGGSDRLRYTTAGDPVEPRYWDSFNVITETQGEIQLAFLLELVLGLGDVAGILADFNGALYVLTNTPAVYKTTDGVNWAAVSMTGGPTTGIRSYVVWRNQMIVATGADNKVYSLAAGDTWTSITPASPASLTAFCDAVSVAPDDKLLLWQNGVGLRSYDGTTWVNVWPPSSFLPAEATCDVLDGSTGTVVMVTRDNAGSSMHEYFTESPIGAATSPYVITWTYIRDTFFYTSRFFNSAGYLGSKKGIGGGPNTVGQGLLWRKERGIKPQVVAEFGDGIRGAVPSQDFGIRALVDDGEKMWIGAPMRAANFSGVVGIPGIYWYEVDADGTQNVSPSGAIDTSPGNVVSKVYGTAVLLGDVFISTNSGIWRRNHLKRAAQGYLDTSIFDLRAPDHVKSWRFIEILMENASPTESVTVYYRPGTLAGSWLGGTAVTASGAKKIPFADDAPSQGVYKYNTRQIQLHLVLARGTDATLYPRLISTAIDAAQIKPIGVS